jgi:hypothetical protein
VAFTSREAFDVELSFATRVAGRLPVKEDQSLSRLSSHRLRSVRKINVAILPMPLKQDTEVFGAQGLLSSGAATDLVVFVHLSIHVL